MRLRDQNHGGTAGRCIPDPVQSQYGLLGYRGTRDRGLKLEAFQVEVRGTEFGDVGSS